MRFCPLTSDGCQGFFFGLLRKMDHEGNKILSHYAELLTGKQVKLKNLHLSWETVSPVIMVKRANVTFLFQSEALNRIGKCSLNCLLNNAKKGDYQYNGDRKSNQPCTQIDAVGEVLKPFMSNIISHRK